MFTLKPRPMAARTRYGNGLHHCVALHVWCLDMPVRGASVVWLPDVDALVMWLHGRVARGDPKGVGKRCKVR